MTSRQRSIDDILPLSAMQEAMFFHAVAEPSSSAYYVQAACRLEGELDREAFRLAWERVVARHAALRTAIVWPPDSPPLQVVARAVPLPWTEHDWTMCDEGEKRAQFDDWLQAQRQQRFPLGRPPLFRLALLRWNARVHWLVLRYHHVILDGWSLPLLWQEALEHYAACRAGVRPASMPSSAPVTSLSAWIDWRRAQDASAAETFWRAHLRGFAGGTSLPLGRAGDTLSAGSTTTGIAPDAATNAATAAAMDDEADAASDERAMTLDQMTASELRGFCRAQHITPTVLLHAAWALVMMRYTGASDVVFGSTVSGRPGELPGADRLVGNVINTVPFRIARRPHDTCSAWLRDIAGQQVALHQHAWTGLPDILRWSGALAGERLFDSIVVIENYPLSAAFDTDGALRLTDVRVQETTDAPLTIVVEPGTQWTIRVTFARTAAQPSAVERLLDHVRHALLSIARHPEARVADLPSLPTVERDRLVSWGTGAPSQRFVRADQMFTAQTARTPDATAVTCGETRTTYAELDRLSDRIARRLVSRGVGAECLVGLYLPRSTALVAAILATWKAGAAWMPLDPAQAPARIDALVRSAKPTLLVTDAARAEQTRQYWPLLPIVCADASDASDAPDGSNDDNESVLPPSDRQSPDQAAYVLYTSGSTGGPKGVVLTHRGLSNYVSWAMDAYRAREGNGAPLHSPIGFDLTLTSLLPQLLSGRGLTLIAEEAGIGALWQALAARPRFGILKLTPAHLALLNDLLQDDELRDTAHTIVIGGEALTRETLAGWRRHAPGVSLVNEYGPTETVVGCCVHEVPSADRALHVGASDEANEGPVPIGRPIAGTQLYVLDADQQLVPAGVPGELYIGGAGVARGYLHDPSQTAARFVPNPFGAGSRLYRSGDRVRLRDDGELEYLGRLDAQIKCAGHRIEPAEIEAALAQHPAVRDCAVGVTGSAARSERLVAWWTPRSAVAQPATADLQQFLRARLPAYLVPAHFISLPAMPLNAHGKVDRAALRDTPVDYAVNQHEPPRNEIEAAVARVWARVLGLGQVGLRDNFFEAGGSSMLALRLTQAIADSGLGRVRVVDLFRYCTVESLAAHLRAASGLDTAGRAPHAQAPAPVLAHEGRPDESTSASPVSRLAERRRVVQQR